MPTIRTKPELTRRDLLLNSAALLATSKLSLAEPAAATPHTEKGLYERTLQSWCDGLLAHQLSFPDPALHGALLCPADGLIHGRIGDAVYPLLRVAHTTGQHKYLAAAVDIHNWSEGNVSRADGSWVNDVTLSNWQGITVFHSIALAEALHHHGAILPTATRQQWTARLARAAKFLDGFITIETGNINYPVTASYAFAICAKVLNEPHYLDRARNLAHASLQHFTPNHLLAGEGHPLDAVTATGCRPIDLGYNVEESLPALVLYATLTQDTEVLEALVPALKAHLQFMLPDGAWDNSWGSRNYKWTYWGSRTSDGCHPAYVLMGQHDPAFREAARRNLELMAACTHNNLLYGGPDYFHHGDAPCIHHAFTHAKALATVLDRATFPTEAPSRPKLPRDEPYGVRSFPECGTHLVSIGDWRATITANDFEYIEHVQSGGGDSAGGHAMGGTLCQLYHQQLGPILTASMNRYQLIEPANQQQFLDKPHMCLTPRIEAVVDGKTYTSACDPKASLTHTESANSALFTATGHLCDTSGKPAHSDAISYRFTYLISPESVKIIARVSSKPTAETKLIVPIIASAEHGTWQPYPHKAIIHKNGDHSLWIETAESDAFDPFPKERTFNLVPGFECVPLSLPLKADRDGYVLLERVNVPMKP
ncbi:MAG: hypothetical protein V4555_12500 [Acidobacteriota bacterium]